MTGIDRVEYEYLRAVLASEVPLFGLVRLRPGYAILDRAGMAAMWDRLSGQHPWGPVGILASLHRKLPALQRRAITDIRRLALCHPHSGSLARTLCETLPAGTVYLNVGHSNLSEQVFTAFQAVPDSRVAVLVHDTIPLDYPQYQRAGSVGVFETRLRLVGRYADLILCSSDTCRADINRHLGGWGRVPDFQVAHLGVRLVQPETSLLPDTGGRPYFVVLGTIEPRKNHRLLLDIWDQLSATETAPDLYIVGRRGWNNRDVFDRLDGDPANVIELNNLPDAGVAALLQGSCGLLFPSFAEGFGLPAIEAAALSVPVICNDLPVFHEVLGNYPVYADVVDMYSWTTIVRQWAEDCENSGPKKREPAADVESKTWDNHFNIVLNRV